MNIITMTALQCMNIELSTRMYQLYYVFISDGI